MSDPVSKYITQQTGITLDVQSLSDNDNVTKIDTLIAANDLPDICQIVGAGLPKQLPEMVTAKEILPLDGYISSALTPALASDNNAQAMIAANKIQSPDGNLYTIGLDKGTWDSGTGPSLGNYIRWDLYAKLGYPTIRNMTDLAGVLCQMQALEPKAPDGKPTYASAVFQGALIDDGNLTTAGLIKGPDYLFTIDIATNQVSDNNLLKDTNSVFWQSLQFDNTLYQKGMLDPNSFTQTYNDYMNNVPYYMDTELSWTANGTTASWQQGTIQGDPSMGFMALPASAFGFTSTSLYSNMIQGERQFVVSASCKNPDRAVQLLDFLSSYEFSRIANNGLEGTNWNMTNGVPTPTQDYLNLTGDMLTAAQAQTGAGYFTHTCGYANGSIDPGTNTPVSVLINAAPPTSVQKDFLTHYNAASIPGVFKQGVNVYNNSTIVDWGTLSSDLQTYETQLQTYMAQQEAACIMAKSDSEFTADQTAFINGLDAFKIDDIFKFYHDTCAANLAKYASVYGMLK